MTTFSASYVCSQHYVKLLHKDAHPIFLDGLISSFKGRGKGSIFPDPSSLSACVFHLNIASAAYRLNGGVARNKLIDLFTGDGAGDPLVHYLYAFFESHNPVGLTYWRAIEENDGDELLHRLLHMAHWFHVNKVDRYARSTLFFVQHLLSLRDRLPNVYAAFTAELKSFSCEDIENMHSALSRYVARLRESYDDKWVAMIVQSLDVMRDINDEVRSAYGISESESTSRVDGRASRLLPSVSHVSRDVSRQS